MYVYKFLLVALFALVFAGCAPQQINVTSHFDVTQARNMLEKGINTIRGSALIRQRGGGVVTCAGQEVNLVPATAYATERMIAIYGNDEKGYNSASLGGRALSFENEPVEYKQLIKKSLCDAQGFFKFEQISNGTFYVITVITWQVNNYFAEGGALMHRVSVSSGETKEIVLAP